MKKVILATMALGAVLSSCENSDWEFPDNDRQAVYFAKQTPIRTLVLGTDVYPNELDNAHKCKIQATLSGVYSNGQDRVIDFAVDNTILNQYEAADVAIMPASYYTLANENQMVIPSGSMWGGVEVQLTDAFFADPKSLEAYYCIPLRIKGCADVDTVLESKNNILYFVNYVNKYDGIWLSQGTDVTTLGGETVTTERKANGGYWEYADQREIRTLGLEKASYAVPASFNLYGKNHELKANLVLSFTDGKCTIAATDAKQTVEDFSYTVKVVAGQGTWTEAGAVKAWGDKDRDQLKLDYTIEFTITGADGTEQKATLKTTEELVFRNHDVVLQEKALTTKE